MLLNVRALRDRLDPTEAPEGYIAVRAVGAHGNKVCPKNCGGCAFFRQEVDGRCSCACWDDQMVIRMMCLAKDREDKTAAWFVKK